MIGRRGWAASLFLLSLLTVVPWVLAEDTPGATSEAVVPTPVFCNNLIRGGGFEQDEGSYPGVGKYWETNDAKPHPEVDKIDRAVTFTGRCSQHLAANTEWDRGMVQQFTDYNTITPGKRYRLEARVRTESVENPAGWYVLGLWWLRDDTWIGDAKMEQQETLNYDWKLITIEAAAPPGANRLGVVLTRHTDGEAWYDDINVVEVGQECTPTPEPTGE